LGGGEDDAVGHGDSVLDGQAGGLESDGAVEIDYPALRLSDRSWKDKEI
jgi:hypothetical protein